MTGDIQFPDVVQLAVPLFIVALLAEIIAIRFFRAGGAYETRDTLTSLIMGAGNVIVGIALGFVAYGADLLSFDWRGRPVQFDNGVLVLATLVSLEVIRPPEFLLLLSSYMNIKLTEREKEIITIEKVYKTK